MSCAPEESTVLCYSVYLVSCRDGSLYTGIATDVQRRLAEHESGRRGAKYLRGKAPLTLVFEKPIGDRGLAQRVESRIKRLPRSEKVDLSRLGYLIDRWLIEAEDQWRTTGTPKGGRSIDTGFSGDAARRFNHLADSTTRSAISGNSRTSPNGAV